MSQRVTNGMMITTFNRNLNKNMMRMERHQAQLATNRKIVRLSDDPIGVIKSVNARSKLNDIGQFNRNVDDAKAWMTASETAVSEINEVLKRAYELTVQASNDVLASDDRIAISNEITQLRDHLVQIGNTTLGDKFIFGGYNVTNQPYTVIFEDDDDKHGMLWYNGASEDPDRIAYNMVEDPLDELNIANKVINYEIGFGIYMDIGVGGVDVMGAGEENLYKMFTDLVQWLNNIDPDTGDDYDREAGNREIQPFLQKFQDAQRKVLAIMADIGGRQNRLDMVSNRYGHDTINYTQMKSDVEDLDQAKAIMEFSMAEAVYRAALSVGARIIQPTLVDFLR
jgi:flagellar hook-associated protein 3 FlgL